MLKDFPFMSLFIYQSFETQFPCTENPRYISRLLFEASYEFEAVICSINASYGFYLK